MRWKCGLYSPFSTHSKVIHKSELSHSKRQQGAILTRRERDVMVQLNHPFLTKLAFSFQGPLSSSFLMSLITDPETLYFITDFANGGNLSRLLGRGEVFSVSTCVVLSPFVASFSCKVCSFIWDSSSLDWIIFTLVTSHIGKFSRFVTFMLTGSNLRPSNVLLKSNGYVSMHNFELSLTSLHSTGPNPLTFDGQTQKEYLVPTLISTLSGLTKRLLSSFRDCLILSQLITGHWVWYCSSFWLVSLQLFFFQVLTIQDCLHSIHLKLSTGKRCMSAFARILFSFLYLSFLSRIRRTEG